MDPVVIAVFVFVYAGMILGGIPGLALDRAGVALLGAIALLASGRVAPEAAWAAVDVPTMGLLFGLMIVSAQFRLGGFYTWVTRRIVAARGGPSRLLALVVAVAGVLSAVLANDIVCLAMAPILVEACRGRGLAPLPYLLGLAAAANVGSAATLIGNPQNMLVGQVLGLSFAGYLADAALPAGLGLVAVWAVLHRLQRGRWTQTGAVPAVEAPELDRWQTAKGLAVLVLLVAGFLFTAWPREVIAAAAAGTLLWSRTTASRALLAQVDWDLLLLFGGLFVVNHALVESGMLAEALAAARDAGVDVAALPALFGTTVVLSNVVSNVPAVMLLLPAATEPGAGAVLALASTLAGNLVLVGSIANLIVVEQAGRLGVAVGWREHARAGVPITLLTLAIAGVWLAL